MFVNRRLFSCFCMFVASNIFWPSSYATITKSSGKTPTAPDDQSVAEEAYSFDPCSPLDFLSQRLTSEFIIKNHDAVCEVTAQSKTLKALVLGYVTPWNSHGYDVAKIFTNKFNFISPVWLQIVPTESASYQIKGTHDVDDGWVQALRSNSSSVKIVPRIILENLNAAAFTDLTSGRKSSGWSNFAQKLTELAEKLKFDGFVAELWSLTQHNVAVKANFCKFIDFLAQELHRAGKIFILVIPPSSGNDADRAESFDRQSFEQLFEHVDYFSLMTYDYSVRLQSPGANAPIWWMKKSVENLAPENTDRFREKRSKILMGLNFYGYLYDIQKNDMQAVTGSTALDLLRKSSSDVVHIEWLDKDAEHFIDFHSDAKHSSHMSRHAKALYFPTVKSIQQRLNLASELGVGVSIWELGQGHDFFYNLF